MPALRIKDKLSSKTTARHNPLACHKSTREQRQSSFQLKSKQEATELEPVLQDHCEGESCCICISTGFDKSSVQLQKLTSTSSDVLLVEKPDSLEATSSPNYKTIFSPNHEHGDLQLISDYQNNGVNYETIELPHLVVYESVSDDVTCSPIEDQNCSLLDFYLCDGSSTLPFDSSMGFTDHLNFDYPSSELCHPDFMIDMTDKNLMLPFLDRTGVTSTVKEDYLLPETMMSSDDTGFYLETHQESELSYLSGSTGEMNFFNPQDFGALPDLPPAVSPLCPFLLPKDAKPRKHATLVLDLDETLVHSTLEPCDDADFTFQVFFSMKNQTVYVRRRPFLQMFLERVAQMFEIFIFTASQSVYASQLLDKLDPEHTIISKRIYRESCIFSDGSYTKDLRILGIDLARVAIIDNSPQVFRLQVNNGIPIKSWFDDPTDHALVQLLPFLETLVDADDVRPLIAEKFSKIEM